MKKFLVLPLLLLTACNPVVKVTQTAPAYTKTGYVSCTHYGICFTCGGISIDGNKSGCGMQASNLCPGTAEAEFRITPVLETLKDGQTRADVIREVTKEGACL